MVSRETKLAAALVVIICLAAISKCAAAPQWHMVNVNQRGQGDAHLLIAGGVHAMVDAGEYDQAKAHLVPYLYGLNVNHIEHFFVSHPHTDHYAGIDAMLDAGITIGNIYYNMPPAGVDDWNYKPVEFLATIGRAENLGTTLHEVQKGHVVKMGSTRFEVLHAQKSNKIGGQQIEVNDYSMVLRWDAGGYRSLFTGDLSLRLGTQLANDERMKSDVLKVPHHGVTGIAPNSFFNKVDPFLAMFPSNRVLWDHPRGQQSRGWVEGRGIKYCHNGFNGHVVLTFENGVNLRPESATSACQHETLTNTPSSPQASNNAWLPAMILGVLSDD